jgi:glutathione S-transferase
MKLAIYMFPAACSRVTMTALEEIGLAYEVHPIDILSGIQKSADYLAVNRKGKVPALLVDGRLMTENAAILHFLDRLHPQAALLPRSEDPVEDNRGLADIVWCASSLHPMVRQIRNPARFTRGETAGITADGQAKLAAECAYISTRVSDGAWWYGERWSIVDTYLYWVYSTAARGQAFPLGDYPELIAHAARVRARPAFQRALAKELEVVASQRLPMDPADL